MFVETMIDPIQNSLCQTRICPWYLFNITRSANLSSFALFYNYVAEHIWMKHRGISKENGQ